MTPTQRIQRQAIRNFLESMTIEEIKKELETSDGFRAKCVQEVIDEKESIN